MTTPQSPAMVEVDRLPELPEPAILRQPEDGELVLNKDGDEPHFWAWMSHGYDTGMWPFFSDDQMRTYATEAIAAERAEVVRLRTMLQDFVTNLEDEHGGDHFEAECPICHAVEDARAALATPTQGGSK